MIAQRILLAILIIVTLTALVSTCGVYNDTQSTEDRGDDNRAVLCSIADLIAHVPAVQFEGESQANFEGWIEARRNILAEIRAQDVCEKEIVSELDKRIEIDARLLEQVRNEAP